MSKAKVTIGRYTNGVEPKIYIEITDELSGVMFVKVEMTPEDFAMAVTGLSMVEGEMTLRNLEKVGTKREIKRETVTVDSTYITPDEAQKLAKPFEVDGWKSVSYQGRRIDVKSNKKTRALEFELSFVRWVDAAAETE